MILSFSIPEMRPYIEAGLRQRVGEDVGTARVKRQTIRRLGPRNRALLDRAREASWTIPYDLQLWWKSRSKSERALIGEARYDTAPRDRICCYPIEVLHSTVQPTDAPEYPVLRIVGPRGWRNGDSCLFWSADHGGEGFVSEAYADGFDSPQAFGDFFVPKVGGRFDGALFRW